MACPQMVRGTSLNSMVGVPHDEDDGEQDQLKLLQQEGDEGTGLSQPGAADPEVSRAAATWTAT